MTNPRFAQGYHCNATALFTFYPWNGSLTSSKPSSQSSRPNLKSPCYCCTVNIAQLLQYRHVMAPPLKDLWGPGLPDTTMELCQNSLGCSWIILVTHGCRSKGLLHPSNPPQPLSLSLAALSVVIMSLSFKSRPILMCPLYDREWIQGQI